MSGEKIAALVKAKRLEQVVELMSARFPTE
jgi:hypothetical protein